jgi:tetratricopeptide (TPR) repeat protein
MSHIRAHLVLLTFASLAGFGRASGLPLQTAPPFPRQAAPLPPSPPDMPIPDPASFPRHDDKAKSPVKRAVDRLTPLCVDWIFHSCWVWGIGNSTQTCEADLKFAKNLEVGDTYFKEKNYRGAESRLREALEYKPNHPEATYKLAVSVDRLGRTGEACELYKAYLQLAPAGPYVDQARKALRKIEKSGNASP